MLTASSMACRRKALKPLVKSVPTSVNFCSYSDLKRCAATSVPCLAPSPIWIGESLEIAILASFDMRHSLKPHLRMAVPMLTGLSLGFLPCSTLVSCSSLGILLSASSRPAVRRKQQASGSSALAVLATSLAICVRNVVLPPLSFLALDGMSKELFHPNTSCEQTDVSDAMP